MHLPRFAFAQKLQLATIGPLAVVVLLAWFFYETTQQYTHHITRTELAHGVLDNYLELENLTYHTLNTLSSLSMEEQIESTATRSAFSQSIRQQIAKVRDRVTAVLESVQSAERGENDPEHLNDIGHLVEIEVLLDDIADGVDAVTSALARGDAEVAKQQLSHLQSAAMAGRLEELIETAIARHSADALEADNAARALGRRVSSILPGVTLLVVAVTVVGSLILSSRLTSSLSALHRGAKALRAGYLDHRIEPLAETEFSHLASAFNEMAKELATHRSALEGSRDALEAAVAERTKDFEDSNVLLEQADHNRRQLLADISHELRTPLTVIRGETQIALRGSGRDVTEYREVLELILHQVDHTTRLVEDLLFMARAEAGAPRFKLNPVDIGSLVADICDFFRPAAHRKHVTIAVEQTDEQALMIGDRGRLHQVFAILLDNALRYSKSEGHIDVRLCVNGDFIQVTVTDNGIGLTKEEAESVFTRFYRGSNAERHSDGTGLGLPVAKAIVESHSGQITLVGRHCGGAQATVQLPIKDSSLRSVA
ncbi:MAG: HAMP domain-containing histidine kinase [Gammaproteobacteria bacterium]|nr:HAMP domain-containing histidine kinase [Gammaproteobacteria bacterium]